MTALFQEDFASFKVFQFVGTSAELLAKLSTWARPPGVAISVLDVARATADAPQPSAAKQAIEAELGSLAQNTGRSLIAATGLHVLAAVYPGGLLQPLHAALRRGNRVLVLVVPGQSPLRLPESARTTDWRASLEGDIGAINTITGGGN